jgi:hypothetical protein
MGRADDNRKGRIVMGAIMSYVKGGGKESETERVTGLKNYLEMKFGIRIDVPSLKKRIGLVRKKIGRDKTLSKLEAKIFTKDGRKRKFRLGSAFCSRCAMFKNYDKECPHCSAHEMTL